MLLRLVFLKKNIMVVLIIDCPPESAGHLCQHYTKESYIIVNSEINQNSLNFEEVYFIKNDYIFLIDLPQKSITEKKKTKLLSSMETISKNYTNKKYSIVNRYKHLRWLHPP